MNEPDGFPSWSAADKEAWIQHLVTTTAYEPVARPELSMAKPWSMLSVAGLPHILARTLNREADMMDAKRPKIIHTEGAVSFVEFETFAESTFSGVLAPPPNGGACGLVRISLAVPPKGKAAVTPGLGLKLFVDGAPSLDLLAMNHTVGQGRDFNLFSNTFTHDLQEEHSELRPPQRLLQVFFRKVAVEPRWLSIDHFAEVDRQGRAIPVEDRRVPNRLVFRPHPDVRHVFRGRQGEDYRETLERIEPASVLYTVEAVGAGADGNDVPIGQLRTTTTFSSSAGGDRLFFRHHMAESNQIPAGPIGRLLDAKG